MSIDKLSQVNKLVSQLESKGCVSDGYHTFNELYFHRMVLFAVICNTYADNSWKSKLHHDGTMYDDYFIVGVTTPEGDFTYHYHIEYWDNFAVRELEYAPEWDGHTSADINRLMCLNFPKKKANMIDSTTPHML